MAVITTYKAELHFEWKEMLPKEDWVDPGVPIAFQTGKCELLIEPDGDKHISIGVGGMKLRLPKKAFFDELAIYKKRYSK